MLILEFIAFEKQRAISASQQKNLIPPVTDGRARHDATRRVRPFPPFALCRSVFPDVLEELDGLRVRTFLSAAADDIHTVVRSIALVHGQIQRSRRSRPRGKLLPDKLIRVPLLREIKRPEILHRRFQRLAVLPSSEVNHIANQRGGSIGARLGQRRILRRRDHLRRGIPTQQKDIIEGRVGVVAAHADHAVRRRYRGSVGDRPGQLAAVFPDEFIACFGQDENLIVPCFVILPDRLWKVGSARDDQGIVVRAGKWSGDS